MHTTNWSDSVYTRMVSEKVQSELQYSLVVYLQLSLFEVLGGCHWLFSGHFKLLKEEILWRY